MTSISDRSGGGRDFPTAPTILSEQEQQAVWFLGALVRVRTHGSTTAGTLAVLDHNGGRGYGSPLHRHRDDEETFIVLDGELRVEVDGVRKSAGAGAAAILPRGAVPLVCRNQPKSTLSDHPYSRRFRGLRDPNRRTRSVY